MTEPPASHWLRAALDSLPDAVVVADESGDVVFRNRAAVALTTARHADALVGRAVTDLIASGRSQHRVLDLHGPPARTIALGASILSEGDGPSATVVVAQDISERRQLEAVRRDFVANVSHELRTPIGALGVLAETLIDEDDLNVVRRLARRIVTESERATRMVEDLLDLSRLEAEQSAERGTVRLADLVEVSLARVRDTAERARVELLVGPGLDGITLLGSEPQLVSALTNLLENGVKYSDVGGTVEVTASADAEWVLLQVSDRGIGIPNKDLERVFERFYRVDRARSRATGGTGLGLAIVRHVAANHGGTVSVTSREGEGSTFTVRLPAASR